MDLNQRIEVLSNLGIKIKKDCAADHPIFEAAKRQNPWFTAANSRKSLTAISSQFLSKEVLQSWSANYDIIASTRKNVGLVLAGNIPAVGFHDILSVFISGHKSIIKMSDKDAVLIEYLITSLTQIEPKCKDHFSLVTRLQGHDAVIATGSNNTAGYFKKYFGHLPHIIRQNRNAIAVINGDETENDFKKLGDDLFTYFGLGCRNVSKMYVPEDYDFTPMLNTLHSFNEVALHHKYKNNFDYNMALFLLNKSVFLNNGSILLREEKTIPSRIASCNYEYYSDINILRDHLSSQSDQIQCIVSRIQFEGDNSFYFGEAQSPAIDDYADGVDTMHFLTTQI